MKLETENLVAELAIPVAGDHGPLNGSELQLLHRSSAISANSSRAACRSATISAAITSGGGEIGGVLQAVIFQPEDIQAGFVAFY